MEDECLPLPLPLYFYSDTVPNLIKQTTNPIVKNMLRVWFEVQKFTRETSLLSQYTPIWGNQRFIPGRADAVFRRWALKGLGKIHDLYMPNSDDMLSFEQIRHKYDIDKKYFFKFLQLRNYVRTSQNSLLTRPPISNSVENADHKREAWKEDLGKNISLEDWQSICTKAHTQSINTRFRLLQYKWLMRTYITPVKLNKYNRNIPDVCTKCTVVKGTLFHCVWQCSKIKSFWEEVKKAIEKIISKSIPMDPALFILGFYPKGHKYKKSERILIDMCLLHARRSIAMFWKNTSRPTVRYWVRQMLTTFPLERVTYIRKGRQDIFERIWEPFIVFVKGINLTIDNEEE